MTGATTSQAPEVNLLGKKPKLNVDSSFRKLFLGHTNVNFSQKTPLKSTLLKNFLDFYFA